MFIYYLIIVHVYVNVCKHVHVTTVYRVQEPFERISSVLAFSCAGPWNQIWVVILASGIFFPMSRLASLCLTPHLCPTLWMLLLRGSKVLTTPLFSTFPQMTSFNQKLD